MANGGVSIKSNNSLLYLALLCLAVFLFQSYKGYFPPREQGASSSIGKIYVEIADEHSATLKARDTPSDLDEIARLYNIEGELKNGDKVILEGDKKPRTGRISGIKSLSLGIPIGINSAAAEDLEALPGIGEKLARRIIDYRSENGRFMDIDALLGVYGMGEKKLSRMKPFINLD